jgi:putative ABC transport system substrate-binding protein
VRRREFITLLGGAATWPLPALAQQMPVIGFLNGASPEPYAPMAAAFRQGLKETGYVEGQNITIEYRWANDHYDRLPALAAELIAHQVTVMAATSTIPIVFSAAADPIMLGLVTSLNRPTGNVTGVSGYISALGAKRLELLRELVPSAGVIGVLVDPNYPDAEFQRKDVTEAARLIGQQIHIVNAGTESDFNGAFATLVQLKAGALVVSADVLFTSRREQLVALAARHKVPAIYYLREFVLAGGLMSYAPDLADGYRQAGIYVGRILKGAQPADLPIVQPTKFELVINLKTAKALNLTVPSSLLATADEVIE